MVRREDHYDEPQPTLYHGHGTALDEEKNGYTARDQLIYALYSEVLDSCQESLTGSSARSRGNKDQSGRSYQLHYRET